MSDLVPFSYDGHDVRVVTIEGEPWFVLADLCRVLGLARSAGQVAQRLDKDVRQTYTLDTAGGRQAMTIVSEAGMYEVVLRSDKPEAVAFRRWVTHEVLPSIRKRGGYLTPEATEKALTDPDFIIRLATDLKAERAKRAELETTVSAQQATMRILEPKASAYDRWLSSNPDYSADIAAKALAAAGADTGRNRLLAHMGKSKEHGGLGMIFRQGKFWHPYQHETERGRLTVKLGRYEDSHTGEVHPTSTVRITAKGVEYLAVQLGVLPADVAAHLEAMENAA